jgi:hypothetical protein
MLVMLVMLVLATGLVVPEVLLARFIDIITPAWVMLQVRVEEVHRVMVPLVMLVMLEVLGLQVKGHPGYVKHSLEVQLVTEVTLALVELLV